MDGPSTPPGALPPTREQGLPPCANNPHCADGKCQARLSQSLTAPNTDGHTPELSRAGTQVRRPKEQPSGARGTFMTINWETNHRTKC